MVMFRFKGRMMVRYIMRMHTIDRVLVAAEQMDKLTGSPVQQQYGYQNEKSENMPDTFHQEPKDTWIFVNATE
jgi:hypothetical protein